MGSAIDIDLWEPLTLRVDTTQIHRFDLRDRAPRCAERRQVAADAPWRPAPAAKRAAPASVSPLAIVARPRAASLRVAVVLVEVPLLERRQPVVAHADLRQRGQLLGQRDGHVERLAGRARRG